MVRKGITSPRKAIGRLQDLIGLARGVAMDDKNPNRAAVLNSILIEAFDVCLCALSGEDLPDKKNHHRAI